MNILIIGGGGREHALAWKLAKSDRVRKIYVAPGNGGTASGSLIIENIDLNKAKTLAPNINQDFVSIKRIKTSGNNSAIFGILNFKNNLIMVPLNILNTW